MTGTAYHPSFGGVINYESEPLPDDPDQSVAATVRRMCEYALVDSRSAAVESAVLSAMPTGEFAPADLLADFHRWIRGQIRFQEDDDTAAAGGFGSGHEVLIRPADLLAMREPVEDCDGFSMLAASMVLAAGRLLHIPYKVMFTTVAANPERPREFSHVYCYVGLAGRLIPFDASHGAYVGWEIRDRFHKRAVWPIGDFMFARTLGRIGRLGQDTVTLDPSIYLDQPIISEPTYPVSTPPTFPAPSSGSGINWNAILPGLFGAGEQIGKQLTLPTGAYVVTGPGGQQIMANQVPGAVPGALNFGASAAGSFGPLLLVGVGVVVVAALFARGR